MEDAPWVRHYQPGVPAEIELPTESLVALYERSVAEAPDARLRLRGEWRLARATVRIQKTRRVTRPGARRGRRVS